MPIQLSALNFYSKPHVPVTLRPLSAPGPPLQPPHSPTPHLPTAHFPECSPPQVVALILRFLSRPSSPILVSSAIILLVNKAQNPSCLPPPLLSSSCPAGHQTLPELLLCATLLSIPASLPYSRAWRVLSGSLHYGPPSTSTTLWIIPETHPSLILDVLNQIPAIHLLDGFDKHWANAHQKFPTGISDSGLCFLLNVFHTIYFDHIKFPLPQLCPTVRNLLPSLVT